MAQKVVGFRVSHVVGASNDRVWGVLGDFGNEHRWTKSLTHCERDTATVQVGTWRTCVLPRPLMGRTRVRERLVEFAHCSALAYELEGGAGPFAKARSRWSTLERSDGTTELTVVGEFVPRGWIGYAVWPLSKPAVKGLTRRVIGELDSFIASA